jgi:hypothetical protein
MVCIELKPNLSSCIEAVSKKEYERTLNRLPLPHPPPSEGEGPGGGSKEGYKCRFMNIAVMIVVSFQSFW